MPNLIAKQLSSLCLNVLKAAGVPEDEAKTVSDHLVEANLAGIDSHGVLRLVPYIKGVQKNLIRPGSKIEVVRETPGTVLLNGNWGFGQVIGAKAMRMAIQRAKTIGICSVAAFNCNHIGRLADYCILATKNDMIGIALVQAGPRGSMAPFGGKKGIMGTNPFCFAIPTNTENPIVLDMATSMVSGGTIRIKHARKERVPEGWILDAKGNPTTDPADWIGPPKGVSLPFGHKGYGLAVMIEIICGALTGVGVGKELLEKFPERFGINQIFMTAINITAFTDVNQFKNHVDSLIGEVKNCPRQEGVDEIFLPGEPEFRKKERRLKEGIYIEDSTWNDIKALANQLNLNLEKYCRES